MKRASGTSLRLGVAIFLALLFPSSALATTTNGADTDNEGNANVSVQSGGEGQGSTRPTESVVRNTGPNSFNQVRVDSKEDVDIETNNNVDMTTNNTQTAISGDAVVSGNTNVGNTRTGDAGNVNESNLSIEVKNDTAVDCGCNPNPVTPAQPTPGRGGAHGNIERETPAPVGGGGGVVLGENIVEEHFLPVEGGGGNRAVLGATTFEEHFLPVGSQGAGFTSGAARPNQLPSTGADSNTTLLISLLASVLVYSIVLRRQKLQQQTASA